MEAYSQNGVANRGRPGIFQNHFFLGEVFRGDDSVSVGNSKEGSSSEFFKQKLSASRALTRLAFRYFFSVEVLIEYIKGARNILAIQCVR